MAIFRWTIGVVASLFASGALLSFGAFIASSVDVWMVRARRFRHWTWLALLLWFNVEVWGRVGYTLVHWVR